jgi:hypothetical protein
MSKDIIGDIHGHADKLEALLSKLGYRHRQGAWRHPSRSAIFVGDLIDRGPGQLRTLKIVRDMIEAGSAKATMGNHEFNAIAWATPDPIEDGFHLRHRHGRKGKNNRHQHQAFLTEVGEDSPQHREWIEWLLDLPLWIEEPGYRVIHACWSPKHADILRPTLRAGNRLTLDAVERASRKGTELYDAIETMLKGVEVTLPAGVTFADKEGHVRQEIRTRWWDTCLTTYQSAYIGPSGVTIPDLPISNYEPIQQPDRPTFIGHYWLDPHEPMEPLSGVVACVDYSVAKGGPLVAYRFDGEAELSAANFVGV